MSDQQFFKRVLSLFAVAAFALAIVGGIIWPDELWRYLIVASLGTLQVYIAMAYGREFHRIREEKYGKDEGPGPPPMM